MAARINLLPVELRQDLPVDWQRLLPKVAIIAVVTAVISAYLFFLGFSFTLKVQEQKLDRQLVTLEPRMKEAREAQHSIAALEKQKMQLEEILRKRTEWSKILWEINDILPQNTWLTSLSVDGEGKLVLQGKSLDLTALGVFVHELNRLPYFTAAKLTQAESGTEGETAVINFQIVAAVGKGR